MLISVQKLIRKEILAKYVTDYVPILVNVDLIRHAEVVDELTTRLEMSDGHSITVKGNLLEIKELANAR
jgi:hypothetical protein